MWLYPFVVVFSVAQSVFGKCNAKRNGEVYLFNLCKACIGMIAVLVVGSITGESFDFYTVIFGVVYGVFLSMSMICGYNAQRCGPMGLSSALASFSFVIPVLFRIIFFGEVFTALRVVGLFVGAVSVFFMCKVFNGSQKLSKKWALNIFLTFIFNGMCSVTQVVYERYAEYVYSGYFTFSGLAFALVFFAVFFIFTSAKRDNAQSESKSTVFFGGLSGVCFGLSNMLTLLLVRTENSGIVFPVFSVLTLAFSVVAGRLIFKEKLNLLQIFGVALSVCAVLLLKLNV